MAIRRYLDYAAVVIDHRLQDGSAEVAAGVQQQLDRLGYTDVIVTTVQVDHSANVGPEAAAREARYRALDAEPERVPPPCCSVTPSTTRPRRCCLGWPVAPAADPWPAWRLGPAICCGRSSTSAGKRPSRPAPSSGSSLGRTPTTPIVGLPAFRVRETVLPTLETELGPGVAEALARTAELLRDDTDLLDRLAADAYRTAEGLGGTDVGLFRLGISTARVASPDPPIVVACARHRRPLAAAYQRRGVTGDRLARPEVDRGARGTVTRHAGRLSVG